MRIFERDKTQISWVCRAQLLVRDDSNFQFCHVPMLLLAAGKNWNPNAEKKTFFELLCQKIKIVRYFHIDRARAHYLS